MYSQNLRSQKNSKYDQVLTKFNSSLYIIKILRKNFLDFI